MCLILKFIFIIIFSFSSHYLDSVLERGITVAEAPVENVLSDSELSMFLKIKKIPLVIVHNLLRYR